jgi:hypothetical protein
MSKDTNLQVEDLLKRAYGNGSKLSDYVEKPPGTAMTTRGKTYHPTYMDSDDTSNAPEHQKRSKGAEYIVASNDMVISTTKAFTARPQILMQSMT